MKLYFFIYFTFIVFSVNAQTELNILNATITNDNIINLEFEIKNASERKVVLVNDFKFQQHRKFPYCRNQESLKSNCSEKYQFEDSYYCYNVFLIKNTGHEFYYEAITTENPIDPKGYFKAERRRQKEAPRHRRRDHRLLSR